MDFNDIAIKTAVLSIMPIAEQILEEKLKNIGITAKVKIIVEDVNIKKLKSEADEEDDKTAIMLKILKDMEGDEE